jgi:hypothetical protein
MWFKMVATKRIGLSLIMVLISGPAVAAKKNNDLKKDFRELCRSALSGAYMDYRNDMDLLRSNIQLTDNLLKRLKAEIGLKSKEHDEILKLLEQKPYDAKLEDKKVGVKSRLNVLKSSHEEKEAEHAKYTAELKRLETEQSDFSKNLEKVFSVKYVHIDGERGRALGLDYLRPCRKFQAVCPLSAEDRDNLLKVLPKERLPDACIKYTTITRTPG